MGPIIKIVSPLENGRVLANREMCHREMYEGFVRCLKGNKRVIINCAVREGGRAAGSKSSYLN
jgi:hypothetical protein